MKKILVIMFISSLISCELFTVDPDPEPIVSCIEDEEVTYTDPGVLILYKGEQEKGFAKAIKLNEEWNCSAQLNENPGNNTLILTSWWGDSSFFFLGEKMLIELHPLLNSSCLELVPVGLDFDSLNQAPISFKLNHDDVVLQEYILDLSTSNYLEIIKDNRETGEFLAKFQVSFTPEFIDLPEQPEHIRFFNGEIHIEE